MTGVQQEVIGKSRYSLRSQDGLENYMSSNQISNMVIRSEVEEDIEVKEAEMIPQVCEELVCYHQVYISIHFIKQNGL